MVAESIAFIYAPGSGARVETDPLKPAEGAAAATVNAVTSLEQAALSMPHGVVLRYGFLYGPGTWSGDTPHPPAIHVDAAAQAALLALARARPGIYNIAQDDPGLSSEKAKREFGFDAGFRFKS
jgi:nucleoside-diphosphate-sugar epimerase